MFSISVVGAFWALFSLLTMCASSVKSAEVCTGKHVELTQNCIDLIASMLNISAFLAGIIEFTSGQPDVNQGQNILEMATAGDRVKFELAITMTFFNFLWFASSIGASLRLYTLSTI